MSFNFKIPLIILDCEMSGLDPDNHQLIQVSALKCDPRTLKVLDKFNSFVGPEYGDLISLEEFSNPTALKNSSYFENKEVIKYSPNPNKVIANFFKWLPDDYIICGYNLDLDYKFIESILEKYDNKTNRLAYRKIDLSHFVEYYSSIHGVPVDIDSKRLEDVCKSFGLKTEKAHDSLNDCKMALELLKHFIEVIKFN